MTLKDKLSFETFSPDIQDAIKFIDEYIDTTFIVQLYGLRSYHNLNHIDELLQTLSTHQTDINDNDTYKLNDQDLFTMVAIIVFHDLVYIPSREDNEYESSKLAQHYLEQILDDQTQVTIIVDVIQDSQDHTPRYGNYEQGDRRYYLGQMMFDLDFTPLGKSYKDFRDDGEKIYDEYSYKVPKDDFNKGRIQFLNSMINNERIFNLDYFYNRYEVATRDNIQKEINERSKLL